MRVISGTARGRRLTEPAGLDIRPTSDMVKESVFNMIQFNIEGSRVLDLFAGTGQLGIEALSRGAKSAVFVDFNPEAIKLIRTNLELCGFTGAATVYARDALKYLKGSGQFDLIFIDAPYNTPLAGETIQKIIEIDKLEKNGIIVCETRADSSLPAVSPPYYLLREYRYGSVKISRFSRENEE